MDHMTEREFACMKKGDLVADREDTIYEIVIEDLFGPPCLVFIARAQNKEKLEERRIDKQNCQSYKRVFQYQ